MLRTGLRADTRTVEVVLEDPAGISTGGERADGWQRLVVSSGGSRFPGWWRRDGVFLLTMVAARGLADPPAASRLSRPDPRGTHPLVGDPPAVD